MKCDNCDIWEIVMNSHWNDRDLYEMISDLVDMAKDQIEMKVQLGKFAGLIE